MTAEPEPVVIDGAVYVGVDREQGPGEAVPLLAADDLPAPRQPAKRGRKAAGF